MGDTEDKIYVLKDLWLEEGQRLEHHIYEDTLRDVGHQYSEEDVHTVKKHLLTPVESAFVKAHGVEENTEMPPPHWNSSRSSNCGPSSLLTTPQGIAASQTRVTSDVEIDQDQY